VSEADISSTVGLSVKLSKAYGALKRYRIRAETAEKALADKDKALAELNHEHEAVKTSASAKRVEELSSELRNVRHKEVFKTLAVKAGVNPIGVDDLYNLSGYKAESDVVDEAGMAKLIEAQKQARAYLFAPAPPAEGDPAAPIIPKPGPASGQGGLPRIGPKYTDEQLSDPAFVMKNYDAIQKNTAERLANGQA
jgi:hypothetical protein